MSSLLLRYGSLALLVAQDTALVLLLRFSRQQAGPMYLSSTAVCCMEVMKLSACFLALLVGEARGSPRGVAAIVKKELVEKPREVGKLAVPAVL